MTERFISVNGLQVALLALLPKCGTRVTVVELMQATGDERDPITQALFHAHVTDQVGFDEPTDSYYARPQGTDLSTERKST